jgi:hypothetical protein
MAFWSAGPKFGNFFHAAESGRRWDEMSLSIPDLCPCAIQSRSFELPYGLDSGPCVVNKWRFGRPVPSVETTFTRPIPVGDGTKCRCRYQISDLAPCKAGHLNCRMVCFLRHRGLSPVGCDNYSARKRSPAGNDIAERPVGRPGGYHPTANQKAALPATHRASGETKIYT